MTEFVFFFLLLYFVLKGGKLFYFCFLVFYINNVVFDYFLSKTMLNDPYFHKNLLLTNKVKKV